MENNKPGWQKTEFWMKLIVVDLPLLWVSVKSFVPPEKAVLIEVAATGVFAVINTIQKALENWKSIRLTTSTTTTIPAPVAVTTTSPV